MGPTLRFVDLFAGIGGFHLAFGRACYTELPDEWRNFTDGRRDPVPDGAYECVWANEWDDSARGVYRRHFGDCDGRDIRTVLDREIPDFDVLCSGFPCPAFSTAGRRRGFEDSRGTLVFDIFRILEGKRPPYFLLENVEGLLWLNGGRVFAYIIGVLTQMGYCVQWCVLDSSRHGVPQTRSRLFVVGNLGEVSRPEILPVGREDREYPDKESPLPGEEEVEVVPIGFLNRNQQNFDSKYFSTLDTCESDGIIHNGVFRHLTPVERERLQGFPDGWTSKALKDDGKLVDVPDGQRLKQLGNAVTVPAVEFLAKRILLAGTSTLR